MQLKMKNVWLSFTPVLFFFLHLPFGFSKNNDRSFPEENSNAPVIATTEAAPAAPTAKQVLMHVYDSLNLSAKGLDADAFEKAVNGYLNLKNRGLVKRSDILSIADFTKSSAKKRLFVIDLKNYKVLFNTYVAHGQNSGQEYVKSFSNENESLQSSPGFYVTSGTYNGSKGFSMYLNGMETVSYTHLTLPTICSV